MQHFYENGCFCVLLAAYSTVLRSIFVCTPNKNNKKIRTNNTQTVIKTSISWEFTVRIHSIIVKRWINAIKYQIQALHFILWIKAKVWDDNKKRKYNKRNGMEKNAHRTTRTNDHIDEYVCFYQFHLDCRLPYIATWFSQIPWNPTGFFVVVVYVGLKFYGFSHVKHTNKTGKSAKWNATKLL